VDMGEGEGGERDRVLKRICGCLRERERVCVGE